jgi:hypothetical protein
VLIAAALLVALVQAAPAAMATDLGATGASKIHTLEAPRPSWYTPDVHQRVLAAGARGITVNLDDQELQTIDCQGYAPDGVSAGGCMVSPSGCTMNFVFVDSSGSKYIGTAGHCVEKVGEPVVMQTGINVDGIAIAKIGNVTKTTGDAGIGQDFGLVKIDPGFAVSPAIPVVGGPQGVFCGDDTGQPLTHYGHGYHFTVQQGYPRAGVVVNVLGDGYSWAGQAFGGDSGSPVDQIGGGQALGNLTHGLGVLIVPIPGLVAGTRMDWIMDHLGSGYQLVNADGSTSPGCPATAGGGGGGGNKGNKGGKGGGKGGRKGG